MESMFVCLIRYCFFPFLGYEIYICFLLLRCWSCICVHSAKYAFKTIATKSVTAAKTAIAEGPFILVSLTCWHCCFFHNHNHKLTSCTSYCSKSKAERPRRGWGQSSCYLTNTNKHCSWTTHTRGYHSPYDQGSGKQTSTDCFCTCPGGDYSCETSAASDTEVCNTACPHSNSSYLCCSTDRYWGRA